MCSILGWLKSASVVFLACITSGTTLGGVVGLASQYRTVSDKRVVDLWMVVDSTSDRFSSVTNVTLTTNASGGFYQETTQYRKTWKYDLNSPENRNTIDSFVTAGTYNGVPEADGEYYASFNTVANSGFTGTSWTATPASAPANSMPVNAGWFTSDTSSPDSIVVENLSGYSNMVYSSTAAQNAAKGYWIAHLVMLDKVGLSGSFTATLGAVNPASQLTVTNFDLFNSPSGGGGAVPEPTSAITLGLLSMLFARKRFRSNLSKLRAL